MSTLHQEHHFESAICDHLARHGWLYAEGDAARYDRHNALFLPDLLAWVEATQPESWQALAKTHGKAWEDLIKGLISHADDHFARSTAERTFIFSNMRARCTSTVRTLMSSSSAISLLARPAITRSITSCSRSVSSVSARCSCWQARRRVMAWALTGHLGFLLNGVLATRLGGRRVHSVYVAGQVV